MKSKSKLLAFVLCMVMLVSMNSTVFAAGNDGEVLQEPMSEVSESLLQFIQENDVYLDENSSIEVFPVATSSRRSYSASGDENEDVAIAVVVTNQVENTLYKDVLLSIYAPPAEDSIISPFAYDWGDSSSWEKRLTIHGIAQAAVYYDYVYPHLCPQAVAFSYVKGTGNNVSYISTKFYVWGKVYSVPSMVDQGYETTYVIDASVANPLVGTQYETVKPFNSSGCIWPGNGNYREGSRLLFNYVVDGVSGECQTWVFSD